MYEKKKLFKNVQKKKNNVKISVVNTVSSLSISIVSRVSRRIVL